MSINLLQILSKEKCGMNKQEERLYATQGLN